MFEEKNTDIESGNMLICESGSIRPVMWATSQDTILEYVWATLEDVNTDEEECTEQDWFIFHAGTHREEIWEWFDKHYNMGVAGLLGCGISIPVLPWA